MPDRSQSQGSNYLPARRSEIFPLAVTTVAAGWDISGLPLKLVTAAPVYAQGASGARSSDWIDVEMVADGGDVYYQFAPDSTNVGTVSTTATLSGGGALTAASPSVNFLQKISSGATIVRRINRVQDRVLILVSVSGTPTLRLAPVSQS